MFSSVPLSLSLLPFVLPPILTMSSDVVPPPAHLNSSTPSSPTSVASSNSWPLSAVGSSSPSNSDNASLTLSAEQAPLPTSPTSPSVAIESNEQLPLSPPLPLDTANPPLPPPTAAVEDEQIHAELAEEPVWPSWSRSRSPSPIEQGMSPVEEKGKGASEVSATIEGEEETVKVAEVKDDEDEQETDQAVEKQLEVAEEAKEEVRLLFFFSPSSFLSTH